jgi:hypothetical protein
VISLGPACTKPVGTPHEDGRSQCGSTASWSSKKQELPELVLSFEQIAEIIDAALPRAAHRASWWVPLRSPRKRCRSAACLAGGYIATRLADGKSVRFKKMTWARA